MSSSTRLDTTTVLLLLFGTVLLVPVLVMGMGFGGPMGYGGMMGGYGNAGGWWLLARTSVQLLLLALVLGGGYLLFRRVTADAPSDPAVEELRRAYACGDLTDEEFEERRARLDASGRSP